MRVIDGDTLVVQRASTGQKITIRLHGIDCPEAKQAGGLEAKDRAKEVVEGKRVGVVDLGEDKYTRTLGAVVELADGNSLQEILLSEGLAMVYKQYCKNCKQWERLQAQAKKAKLGIWQDDDPMPPWEYRKSYKNLL